MKSIKKLIITALAAVGAAVCLSVAAGAYHMEFEQYGTGNIVYGAIHRDTGDPQILSVSIHIECTLTQRPTCTEAGEASYDGFDITVVNGTQEGETVHLDAGTFTIPATGHIWKGVYGGWEPHPTETPAASCTEGGWAIRYCQAEGCDHIEEDANHAPLGHEINVDYIWSGDYSTCSLTFTCERNCGYLKSLTIDTTSEVFPATAQAGAFTRYSADFNHFDQYNPRAVDVDLSNDGIETIFQHLILKTIDVPYREAEPDPDPEPAPVWFNKPDYTPSVTAAPVETEAPEPEETTAPEVTEEPEITTVPEIVPETTTTAEEVNIPVDRGDNNPHTGAALGGIAILTLAGAAIVLSKKRK